MLAKHTHTTYHHPTMWGVITAIQVFLFTAVMASGQVSFDHRNLWKVGLDPVWDVSPILRDSLRSNSMDLLSSLVPSQYMLGSNTYSLLHFH